MNPSQTLRDIAQIAQNPVVKARLEQLASEFEAQHNQQNNNWGIALGMAQNTWEQGLDDLRTDLLARIDQRDKEIIGRLDLLLERLRGGDDGSG
jgi:hypothetical protein